MGPSIRDQYPTLAPAFRVNSGGKSHAFGIAVDFGRSGPDRVRPVGSSVTNEAQHTYARFKSYLLRSFERRSEISALQ